MLCSWDLFHSNPCVGFSGKWQSKAYFPRVTPIHVYVYVSVSVYIYIFVCVSEYVYVYVYVYIYIHIYLIWGLVLISYPCDNCYENRIWAFITTWFSFLTSAEIRLTKRGLVGSMGPWKMENVGITHSLWDVEMFHLNTTHQDYVIVMESENYSTAAHVKFLDDVICNPNPK